MSRKPAVRSPKRATPSVSEPPRSPMYRGFAKATFSLRPDQLDELRNEARRRAEATGVFRPDASEVVREAIDMWLRQRRR